MGLFNAQEGVSQLYYTLSSFIPALLFGIRHITLNRKWRQKTVCIIVILITGIQCFWFFHDSGVLKAALYGFNELTGLKEDQNETVPYSMQYADYEALVWARDNTESDSLFLTDRSVLCDLDNYMYYGTFSERQMYLEGDRYFYGTYTKERERRREIITSLYNNDIEAFDASVTDGVDYIIQTKWITPEYDGYGCTRVFETDTITIWKING